MSDAKKAVAGTEVLAKRNLWVDDGEGKVKKVLKGTVLKLSADQIKAFGAAVTKDVPAKEGDE
jgi:hypothetical protein